MSSFRLGDTAVEQQVREIGEQLFAAMDAAPSPGIFSKKGAYARVMEWSMKDPAFKAQLFRFVDVLPALKSSAEIVRHLQEYLGDMAVELNPAMKVGLAASSFAPALLATPVKANVVSMASQFVAGAKPDDLMKQLRRNSELGIATTIDLLGETVVSEAEADVFLQRNLDVLETVAAALPEIRPGHSDSTPSGSLPRLNLSVKISALTPDVHPADPESSIVALKQRLRPILRRARDVGAFVNFDMESYKLKDLTLALFKSILDEEEFAPTAYEKLKRETTGPMIGIALQAYLRDCEHDLTELIAWARRQRHPIGVRLVKGAYWDYETITAQQRGWANPVWSRKPETDANFEALSLILLKNIDIISPAFASHNVRSCAHVIAQANRLEIDSRAYEFQALFGMADELKRALVQSGHRVREYCAIGELLPGMAYLVRRLLENTSNEGFLRMKNLGEATREELLADPVVVLGRTSAVANSTTIEHQPVEADRKRSGFRNAPNTDFTIEGNRQKQRQALAAATSRLGRKWPIVIGGRTITDREWIASTNPARPAQVIGHWARGRKEDADAAIEAARAAQPAWRNIGPAARADVVERIGDLIEARRFELNALEILEAGKPWVEADGDISEAVDFCRFYAAEMRRLGKPQVTQHVPGESCVLMHTPRGVGAVIAPWNFPLAILTGLTVAPLVAGNGVVIKPAEQTTGIASELMTILTEAGVPAGVANLVPGYGEDVGAHLAGHPEIDFVAFTGSKAVGCSIWETAGRTPPGQMNLKKVVCEMGGKNALIIDSDADLDEAIPAAVYSAFGFSGQKCSAMSRLIVLDDIYDAFVPRFLAACASIPVGDPTAPGTVVGPVIDDDAKKKITAMIARGCEEGRIAFQATIPSELRQTGGHYVPPTVFVDLKPKAFIAREEIFGPVVAILRARSLEAAFAITNDVDFALTAGLFSRSPSALARARDELMAGNVYLNRGTTGAIVQRHPFGGFRMSGGGTKAGGEGYLENFMFPRVVAENVMRRGFTPPED